VLHIARLARILVAFAIVVVLAACRVHTDVDVRVRADGSGTVRVHITLDADAARRVPVASIRLDDLTAAGWSVTRDASSITLTKPFARPEDLGPTLRELTGPGGVLGAASLTRTSSFLRTREALRVDVDLRAASVGVASDPDLVARLRAAGVDPAALANQLDASARGAVDVELHAHLPGGVTRSWTIPANGQVQARAGASTWNGSRFRLLVVAVVLGAVAVLVGAAAVIRGGRARRGTRGGTRPTTPTPPPLPPRAAPSRRADRT
jgi:hypothetical protein